MSVVTLHPVIVHLERILRGLLTIDEYLAVLHFQGVTLIGTDRTLVDRQVLQRQVDALAFGRNPDRTVVVACPVHIAVQRIDVQVVGILVQFDALYDICTLLQLAIGTVGQRHIAIGIQAGQVFHRDAQLLHELVGQALAQLDIVRILHIVWLLVGLAVDIHDAVLDLQRLTRQSHAALDVVLTTIGRTCINDAILLLVIDNLLTASLIDGVEVQRQLLLRQRVRIRTLRIHLITHLVAHLIEVVSLIASIRTDGVASRIVEHHDIVKLYLAQTFYATIVPVGPFDVRFALEQRQCMLCQGHCQRCLRNTRTITHLRHEEVVTRQQRLLQRTRWNDVVLKEKEVDEVDGYECKHQRVDPRHYPFDGTLGILPPLPLDFLGDVNVVDKRNDQQAQPRLYPVEEYQITQQYDDELRPLHLHIQLFLFSLFHDLEFKHIADGQQSLMLMGILGGKHSTKGKALTRMGVVSDGDDVGFRVVAHRMDAWHLATTDMVDAQQLRVGGVLGPRFLAVDILYDALSQRNSRATRVVQLVHVMGFLHLYVVLWELVHNLSQILVHS